MSTPSNISQGLGRKPVRSISGVTPLTVVLKPRKCDHGTCIYCPGGDTVPQSYTDKSPAVMRAMKLDYDPYEQVSRRLAALQAMRHQTEKIELILLGGTFLQYPNEYKYNFIKRCYDALNGVDAKDLQEAKKINETAEHRCVALCIENRPDDCSPEEVKQMLDFGATRIELGVQHLDNEVYQKIARGHSVQDVVDATRRLKDTGFKIGYHIMPGLPGVTRRADLEKFDLLFSDESFKPDQLKLYPCQVVGDSPLAKLHERMEYVPYTREETISLLKEMMAKIPNYCRVMRVMREFPTDKLVSGVVRLDVRKEIEDQLREESVEVKEIRMREIGFRKDADHSVTLQTTAYPASGGEEYFLEFSNKEGVLFGLLRLRFPSKDSFGPTIAPELEGAAIVRELHVYGQALGLTEKGKEGDSQHVGLGKQLMAQAESITRDAGYKKLAVISGIGVREYYKKLGYTLEGYYMVKDL